MSKANGEQPRALPGDQITSLRPTQGGSLLGDHRMWGGRKTKQKPFLVVDSMVDVVTLLIISFIVKDYCF